MRILMVMPFLPYPLTDGGRIGFWNPIKYLSRANEIVLVSYGGSCDERAVQVLREHCVAIELCPRPLKSDSLALLRGTIGSPPGSAAKYWSREFSQVIANAVRTYTPDLVEFHHLNTAVFRQAAGNRPAVLREHNVEYKVWERYAQHAESRLGRWYGQWSAPRVRRFEARAASDFHCCVVVTEADAQYLRAIAPRAKVEAIPSGVDTEYFRPDSSILEEPWSMVLTGSFAWKPKQHNLRRVVCDIFPHIKAKAPQASLKVVGTGVPPELRRLAEAAGVHVVGEVPDVRPYVWSAAVAINYLESGGGIALKVLEAMAMRKPVLANRLGCEGIEAEHGEDIFVADSVDDFVDAAVLLLNRAALRAKIAEGGFALVQSRYAWNVIARSLQDCYEQVVNESRSRLTHHNA